VGSTDIFEGLMAKETQIGGNHYKALRIQPYEYIMANNIPYLEANVIKYVTRHRLKGRQEDIKKAIHNLELLLEDYDKF
jgi:hypothetical protein